MSPFTMIGAARCGAGSLLLLLACHGLPAALAEDWSMTYSMDTVPVLPGWFGDSTRSTVENGMLRIVDPSDQQGSGHFYHIEWGASPASEAVAEARIKVLSSEGNAGVALWVSNGVHEEGIQFHADRVNLAFSRLEYRMDTTDDFHVYRVTIQGQDLKFYVDGKLAIDASGKFTEKANVGQNLLAFGSGSSAAKGESLWDWVRFRSPLEGVSQPGRKPLEHMTIFRQADTYAVFPILRHEAGTDRLSVGFRAGGPKSHLNDQGARTLYYVSTDGGKSWQEGPPLPDKPFSAPDGRLIRVGCKWWQHYPASERHRLEQQGYRVIGGGQPEGQPATVAICVGADQLESNDGGKTWEQQDIKLPFMALMACWMNGLQLPDGAIIYPVYGVQNARSPDSSWVLRSENYGQTWELNLLGSHPDGKTPLNETAVIELKGGRLLAVMRTDGGSDHLWQAFSDDRGRTWHSLRDTGIQGHPPHLLRLQDGRILLSYGYRHLPFGIRAAVSHDEGATWDLEHIWVLREDGGGSDLGYPQSVQLGDGTVVTVYYFVEPGGMQYIAATRWNVPR